MLPKGYHTSRPDPVGQPVRRPVGFERQQRAQQRALGNTELALQQNNAVGQHVCRFHLHVIPNTPLDLRETPSPAEVDAIAQRLKATLPDR